MSTNVDDTRCAPSKKYKDGSCFTEDALKKIVTSYNEKTNKTIEVDVPKKDLVKKITEILQNKCDDQACWLRQEIVANIEDEDLLENTLRPIGPKGKYQWLSTMDIDKVVAQYHSVHKDFIFLGAVPYDFEEIGVLELKTPDLFDDMIKNGKTKFGIVINLDTHDMGGSHWVGLYADFNNNQIYFFDSVGKKPRKKIKKFINSIVKYMYKKKYPNKTLNINNLLKILQNNGTNEHIKNLKEFDIRYNKMQHQYKDTECGVYSINFIIRLLEGEQFDEISNNPIKDDIMNENRHIYFVNSKE
jgi:hypothetical protein